jgi:glutathione S-transferase
MRRIYHIETPSQWRQAADSPYQAESLTAEGFIHCSNRDQVARVANLFYADQAELLVLDIDAGRLASPLRDEDGGTGEQFPHVYGPINRDAVVAVRRLQRDAENRWAFPEDSTTPSR